MKSFVLIPLLSLSLFSYEVDFKVGEEIYLNTCASCHGVDGKVNKDIQFVVKPRNLHISILDEEQSYNIIKKGAHYWGAASAMMPSFESVYSEDELRSVAHYISKKFNPNSQQRVKELYAKSDVVPKDKVAKMLKRGKKIYKRNCSWCHGVDAKGDGLATHNPEKSIYPYNLRKTLLTSEQIFLYAKHGGQFWGTDKNDMPSWSRKYDDYSLKSVVKYIESEFRTKE